MKKILIFCILLNLGLAGGLRAESQTAPAPEAPPPGMAPPQESSTPPKKLHGKALKENEASLQLIDGIPQAPYKKLGPIWSSKGSMKSTMKDLRKQAAKMGADAVINIHVRTEKMHSSSYDPGWYGGFGPYGGYWGGMSYWGGYASTQTWVQPVVTGWAVKWEGAPPQNVKTLQPGEESLQQQVENAPEN